MEPKDIDLFIKAKRKTMIPSILTGISLVLFSCIIVLDFMGIEYSNTKTILTWAISLYLFAFGAGKWAFVSRKELINIIERQINNDAEALSYLANKTSKM
ncbi:MAG: hypothetical protein K6L75_10770 [Cellvibrionaceae bacterium]